MRKPFLSPAIFLTGAIIILQSCAKESPSATIAAKPGNIIKATIAGNQAYQLPISSVGNVSISKQASHFQVSQTQLDPKNGSPVYKYVPADGYTGTDEVVLSTKTAVTNVSTGGCGNNSHVTETIGYNISSTIIKINIQK